MKVKTRYKAIRFSTFGANAITTSSRLCCRVAGFHYFSNALAHVCVCARVCVRLNVAPLCACLPAFQLTMEAMCRTALYGDVFVYSQ